MDIIKKAVGRRSGNRTKTFKHEKLSDEWGHIKDPIIDGVTFYMKYLGSTLVEEIDDDESYGTKISSHAIKTIVNMAKNLGKKLPKVAFTVRADGVSVYNLDTRETISDLSIYRVNFCTADRYHGKVFAYIARNTTNETMECQAFLCSKRKVAQAITLSVAQAFKIAEEWELATNTVTDDQLKENYSPKIFCHPTNFQTSGSVSPSSSSDGLSDSNNYSSSLENLAIDHLGSDNDDDFANLAQTRIQISTTPFSNNTLQGNSGKHKLEYTMWMPTKDKSSLLNNVCVNKVDDLLLL